MFYVLSLALAAAFPLGCSSGTSCNLMACSSQASFAGEVATVTGMLDVELCVNGSCQTHSVALSSERDCVDLLPPLSGFICFDAAAGTRRISGSIPAERLNDGDTFTVRISDAATASVLANAEQRIAFERYYIDAPECGDPCRRTTITVEPAQPG